MLLLSLISHIHSNKYLSWDPGLVLTIGGAGLVQLWTYVEVIFHVLKFMFSASQIVIISYYSRHFHTIGVISIN